MISMDLRFYLRVMILLCLMTVVWGCGAPEEKKTENSLKITAHLEVVAPKTGQNTLMIEIKAKDGSMIKNAEVKVHPHMPAHGHGSSEKPKIEELGDGKYKASPITFQMPGEWEIVVEATSGSETGKYTMTVQVK